MKCPCGKDHSPVRLARRAVAPVDEFERMVGTPRAGWGRSDFYAAEFYADRGAGDAAAPFDEAYWSASFDQIREEVGRALAQPQVFYATDEGPFTVVRDWQRNRGRA